MTTLWKLTDAYGRTYGATRWGPGVTHCANGKGDLCARGWIHAYPRLVVLLNPTHANFKDPLLWRATGIVGMTDYGLKVGCTELTTIEQVEAPVYSRRQRIAFGIWCASAVCCDPKWCAWADGWLSGRDRSMAEATAAARTAGAVAAAPLDLDAIALRALEWRE